MKTNPQTKHCPKNHEFRSRSDETCQSDMLTLKSFHTPNVFALHCNANERYNFNLGLIK